METMPTPALGPTSSLTAIGPDARTTIGFRPAAVIGGPDTNTAVPGATVPVATTLLPVAVVAAAL